MSCLNNMPDNLVIVRGGGDIATGSIERLWGAGFPVLVLESDSPSSIRRQVSVSEAVYDGTAAVEDMTAVLVRSNAFDERTDEEIRGILAKGNVPVIVDPEGRSIMRYRPMAVIDAILAKKNIGTFRKMSPESYFAALGPGFCAGERPADGNYEDDTFMDAVVETMRGHNLARIIKSGAAMPNTGVPGVIAGVSDKRVIHSPAEGVIENVSSIGDIVTEGQVIARIYPTGDHGKCMNGSMKTAEGASKETAEETAEEAAGAECESCVEVKATITGLLRGLIRTGYYVTCGFKIADIDPRKEEIKNCFTISDKSRCIGGSVLELVCAVEHQGARKE